jgi:hypothetical protein
MSDVRNRPPTDLLEMFERREGDVRPAMPMPGSIRRGIRARRGTVAVAGVASALALAVVVRALPLTLDTQPAVTPTTAPPTRELEPTASGRTELFRWRVLAGSIDGRLETELQTSSLSGGDWSSVSERSFDPAGPSFTASFLLAGPFVDRPSEVVVWGFVPSGADHVVFESGEGCDTITIESDEVVAAPGSSLGIWGTKTRCGGVSAGSTGTVSALGPSGDEIASNGYGAPVASDVWAVTTARRGGVGWVLRRLLDNPTGIAIGDAGIPNDLRSPIRGDQLSADAPVAWGTTPPAGDGTFVFGISAREVDHVILVLPDGETVDATFTIFPEDPFDVFWADVPNDEPSQLVAFDARCQVLANESMNGRPVGDPPPGACTPNG